MYRIKNKPACYGNAQVNSTIEIIHRVLGKLAQIYNLHETHVDDADPWMVILAADAFAVHYAYHQTKSKIPGQIVFGQYMQKPRKLSTYAWNSSDL